MDNVYEVVKLSAIQPDETQPRKYFDAARLHMLKKSIEKEGIISPLIVEKVGDQFLLIDGERRYRAAQELNLKEVPVIVEPVGDKVSRLTRRFTVQEQHEGWSPTEKANALIELAEEVGVTLYAACKLLNINESDINRYVAFSQLVDREAWVRSEVSMDFSVGLRSLRNKTRKLYEEVLKKEFTTSEEKKLEKRVIQSIKDGSVKRRHDLTRLKDAFTKNPKLIEIYLSERSETPSSIYLKAEAQGATYLRQTVMHCKYMSASAHRFLEQPDVKPDESQVKLMKTTVAAINKILDMVE